jgi:hypothetical protein
MGYLSEALLELANYFLILFKAFVAIYIFVVV